MQKSSLQRLYNGMGPRYAARRVPIQGVIHFKSSLNNVILDVLRNREGWQEIVGDEEEWDFYWCDREWLKENFDKTFFPEHVRICHFRNHYELTRKNLMVKNLKRMRKKMEKDSGKTESSIIDFFPTTFELPNEYHMFLEEFKKTPNSIWIMKPVAKSQGRGIFLFRRLKDIEAWKKSEGVMGNVDTTKEAPETYVVSKYIDHPYLVCGKKFDLRIYVLVTSYNPLKVWLYREGFARFSNSRFTLSSIEDSYIHLTNVAIQKNAPDFDPDVGLKWSIQNLRRYLTAKHGQEKVDKMFYKMDQVFINSLLSVQKVMINDKHCFELYGYDILLDKHLKPWLVEINASPSFSASNQDDYRLKRDLLSDTLDIVDMEGRLTGAEKQIGGFDLIWDDGAVKSEDTSIQGMVSTSYSSNSFLGCLNNRDENLKRLSRAWKSLAND